MSWLGPAAAAAGDAAGEAAGEAAGLADAAAGLAAGFAASVGLAGAVVGDAGAGEQALRTTASAVLATDSTLNGFARYIDNSSTVDKLRSGCDSESRSLLSID
ncbi:MAG TPA: hypothetical protein VHX16_13690 [Chloroflexota bacterium]|nr:hypothetical protein [Chloroflexota bacterium]